MHYLVKSPQHAPEAFHKDLCPTIIADEAAASSMLYVLWSCFFNETNLRLCSVDSESETGGFMHLFNTWIESHCYTKMAFMYLL